MGTWTEITIKVIDNEKAIIDELDRMYGPRFFSVSKQDDKTTIRLTFEDYDEVEDELRLWNVLLNASRNGAKALLHTFTADEGGWTKIIDIGFEHFEGLLAVDRLIRDMDLALLYAKVGSGEESPETLGKAFADMVIDPQEPEEIDEAYAIAELLMKHSYLPSQDHEEGLNLILDAFRTARESEGEDERVDWKVRTGNWLATVLDIAETSCLENEYGFDFLPQPSPVVRLLDTCIKVIPCLPEKEKLLLIKYVREFNDCGSRIVWSPMDVDQDDEHGLTDEEKREAISRFIRNQRFSDSDWIDIDKYAREVVAERSSKVEVKKLA